MTLQDEDLTALTDRPAGRGALAAFAYQQIRERLIHSHYRGGERLVLRPLAASLKLSPTPVREALLRLVSEQALELDERNTARVPAISRAIFVEIHALRADIEERLARNVAEHIKPEQIAVLEECHNAFIRAYEAEDSHGTAVANAAFHSAVADFSTLTLTAGFMHGLWTRIGPIYAAANGLPDISPADPNHPHLKLLEAFRLHDATKAAEAMRRDFAQAQSWLEPLLPS
ncbi:GntR family transcriptional regulator [Acetobacter indonesiensis NRIC 0313]|uniref:GntR family transcriptional regulator n=1 Tax=Acetobacter indonesiensis TaxID=104101 RepID=A0A6N3T3F7_9PROT|nr:GntR family transcriptional regulator [Acetobacter indonesiensis]GAN62978.1 transcriptional regulator GntR [Acetobacter indonesiensis]GBQ56999.1 GntR family transcriptional regulator [Acetobacter indonesiensis NRIC 0313]GEN02548.1 GntR family transcriptional regulator [Acetobacter indonesiensis]